MPFLLFPPKYYFPGVSILTPGINAPTRVDEAFAFNTREYTIIKVALRDKHALTWLIEGRVFFLILYFSCAVLVIVFNF